MSDPFKRLQTKIEDVLGISLFGDKKTVRITLAESHVEAVSEGKTVRFKIDGTIIEIRKA